MFEAMRFQENKLYLIDQTKLPHYQEWVACGDAKETARAIAEMKVRGAPAIGCAAAYGVVLSVISNAGKVTWKEMAAAVISDIDVLASSRPTAVNLFYALNEMRTLLSKLDDNSPYADVLGLVKDEADRQFQADIATCKAIGKHGAGLFEAKVNILTHCNTGSLATAGYGTALGVVRSLHEAGKIERVYADETRPYLQGARLTAFELVEEKIPATLICDSAAAYLMSQKKIDGIIVGADRIAANGDAANKIGTYSLAVAAKYHGVPFYVAAPTTTIDRKIKSGSEIPIELRDESEVKELNGAPIAPSEIDVWNPSFDVTPAELITAIITEEGVHSGPYRF